MEESDEYRWAVQVVIKRQMRHLMEQLKESGQEVAVMSVNLDDNTCSHFGTDCGDWFISEQKNLTKNFLKFCQAKSKVPRPKKSGESETSSKSPPAKKQKTSDQSDTSKLKDSECQTTLHVNIPRQLAGNVSDQELAGLVGRLVASQAAKNKRKDGWSTKFEELVKAIDLVRSPPPVMSPKSTPKSVAKTPNIKTEKSTPVATRSTRSGRKVSSKFQDSINYLKTKKHGKTPDNPEEDNVEIEVDVDLIPQLEGEVSILEQISHIDRKTLNKVSVSTVDGAIIDLETTPLTCDNLESIAGPVIKELQTSGSGQYILVNKQMKVIVSTDMDDDDNDIEAKVTVTMETAVRGAPAPQTNRKKPHLETPTQSVVVKAEDVEELEEDYDENLKEELDEYYGVNNGENDSDPEFDPEKELYDTVLGPQGCVRVEKVKIKPRTLPKPTAKMIRKPKYRSVSETQQLECQTCGITLTGKSNLKSHIRRVHMGIRNNKCGICSKSFWSSTGRESHMLSVHTRRCDGCQEYVVESVPWGQGVDMRTQRDVICTCGAIVSIYTAYGRKRMYLRDDEPDEFGEIKTPAKQRESASSGTKYACGTCGKLFLKKSNCERHSRAHTDIKDCVCYICGNSYTYENSLKKHMANEHGVLKFTCELCGGNYSNPTALKAHKAKAHQSVALGENVAIATQSSKSIGTQNDGDLDEEEDEDDIEEIMAMEEEEAEMEGVTIQTIEVAKGQMVKAADGHVIQMTASGDTASTTTQIIQVAEGETVPTTQHDIMVSEADNEPGQVQGQIQTHYVQIAEAGDEQGQTTHMVQMADNPGQVVHVTTAGDHIIGESEAGQIIQQAIQDGQVISQEGGMSIIIKQITVAEAEMQNNSV